MISLGVCADVDRIPQRVRVFESALRVLEEVTDRVEADYRESTCPAILRVWADEIEALRADLRLWVRRMAESTSEWIPSNFELSFGLSSVDNRDPASVTNAVTITDGFLLRGIVDLVESRVSGGTSGLPITSPVRTVPTEILWSAGVRSFSLHSTHWLSNLLWKGRLRSEDSISAP